MRQNNFLPIAIFALNGKDEAQERFLIERAGFTANKSMIGVYQGKEERAWLVPITSSEQKARLLELAAEYKQESVLFSGIDRTCQLHFVESGRVEHIGVLSTVSEQYAKGKESYSFDPESGNYYVAG